MIVSSPGDPQVSQLVLEYGGNNLALASARPRLTWLLDASAENWRQAGWEAQLATDDGAVVALMNGTMIAVRDRPRVSD